MSDKIKIINPAAKVKIELGTAFYKRLQDAALYLLRGKTKEEIQDAMDKIQKEEIKEDWIAHYQTLLILLAHYEQEIIKNNLYDEIDPSDA